MNADTFKVLQQIGLLLMTAFSIRGRKKPKLCRRQTYLICVSLRQSADKNILTKILIDNVFVQLLFAADLRRLTVSNGIIGQFFKRQLTL